MNDKAPLFGEEESLNKRFENYEKTQTFNQFQDVMFYNARKHHIPYKGTFELTPRCNLHCKMCYMRLDPHQIKEQGRELTADEWISLGRMAFDMGTVDLLLTGGEIMLRSDFPRIYTALTDMGFLMRLFTNATLVTPEILDLLRDRPPQSMEITLYGASEDTYQRVCGWGEGYKRATQAIDELRTFLPSIALKTTLIRDNASDFPAMTKWANERALKLEYTALPFPAVRGACSHCRECRMDLEELVAFHEANGLQPETADCAQPDPSERKAIYCPAGEAAYVIEWTGNMVACNADDDPDRPVGKPLEEGFENVWNRLAAFRTNKSLPKVCYACPVYAECSCCAVHHRIESGHYDKRAQYVCDFVRKMHGLELLGEDD